MACYNDGHVTVLFMKNANLKLICYWLDLFECSFGGSKGVCVFFERRGDTAPVQRAPRQSYNTASKKRDRSNYTEE